MTNTVITELLKTIVTEQNAFVAKIEEIEQDILGEAYDADQTLDVDRIDLIESALAAAHQLHLFARHIAIGSSINEPATILQFAAAHEMVDQLSEKAMALSNENPDEADDARL